MRISAFNRSCERKQSHIYPSRSLKKVPISIDHEPILFSAANPADEVFGRHRDYLGQKDALCRNGYLGSLSFEPLVRAEHYWPGPLRGHSRQTKNGGETPASRPRLVRHFGL